MPPSRPHRFSLTSGKHPSIRGEHSLWHSGSNLSDASPSTPHSPLSLRTNGKSNPLPYSHTRSARLPLHTLKSSRQSPISVRLRSSPGLISSSHESQQRHISPYNKQSHTGREIVPTHKATPFPDVSDTRPIASLYSDIYREDYVLRVPPTPVASTRTLQSRRQSEIPTHVQTVVGTSPTLPSPNMVFQTHCNYLAAKLDVHFDYNGVVDMVGGPHTSTGYSLPGHILINLPALPSPMEGRLREVRELSIIMEGKSEFWDDNGRYTPLRLHTTTLSIATPANPLLLPSHDPSRPHANRIQLAVGFDLHLPGWLPPSHTTEMTTTSYGVVCQAILGWTEATSSTSAPSGAESGSVAKVMPLRHTVNKTRGKGSFEGFFLNQSLLPESTDQSASKWAPFTIVRHRLPVGLCTSEAERNERHYTLRPETDSTSPVECIVTVPEWVDVYGEERSLRVALKLRARREALTSAREEGCRGQNQGVMDCPFSADSHCCARRNAVNPPQSVPMQRESRGTTEMKPDDEPLTQMLELGMEVEEIEKFSSTPSSSFTTAFPITKEQPSRHSSQHQLISPRPVYADGGLMGYEDRPFKGIRTRSRLLSDEGTQRSFFFPDGGLSLTDRWRKVNIVLPMPGEGCKGIDTRPQAEMNAPFLVIKHSLKIRVVCRGLEPGAQDTVVILSTPIRFGTSFSSIPSALPRPAPLPTYGQLFHENGDLKDCDPLPLYTRHVGPAGGPYATKIGATPVTPAPAYKSLFGEYHEDGSTAAPSRSPSPLALPRPADTDDSRRNDADDEAMDIDSCYGSGHNGRGSTSRGVSVPLGRKGIDMPRALFATV